MDEQGLIEKLRRIEALHAGATTEGERVAAAEARKRILARLGAMQASDPPVEFRFTIVDPWSRQVFNALLRRYELRPYRYARQKQQTIMVRVSTGFVNHTLWPEFQAISRELRQHLAEVTSRVIKASLDASGNEAEEVDGAPQQLGPGRDEA